MEDKIEYPILKNHYTRLCYPFLFDKQNFKTLRASVLKVPGIKEICNDKNVESWKSEYFLPPLRRVWYPHYLPEGHLKKELKPEDIIGHFELPIMSVDMVKSGSGTIVFNNSPIEIQFENILLDISYLGIGFITIEIKLKEERSTFDKLLIMNSALRMTSRSTDIDVDGKKVTIGGIFDSILDSFRGAMGWSDRSAETKDIVLYGDLNDIFYDRVLCFSYSCIEGSIYDHEDDLFIKYWQLWNPEVNSILSDIGTEKDYGFDRSKYHLSMWKHAIYGFSKEGMVVFSDGNDSFNEKILPIYFGSYYYDIFLIAVVQRMVLLRINRQLSHTEKMSGIDRKNYNAVIQIRRDLLEFANKCVFTQASNYELGQLIWRKLKDVFEMEDLLSEVKSQCDELSGYMEASRQALINDFMNILSYIVIPASLILAIFSSNFLELQNVSLKSNWVSFAFIAAFILAFVVWQVLKRKEKKD